MNYQEFVQRVQHNMHETIYEDSEGRSILVIDLLDAFAFANKLIEAEREAIAQMVEPWLLHEYVEKIRNRGQA
jgi:regulator of RNase E activity RraB